MKLLILLVAVTWTRGANLDRTYLPPSYAQTSGGNGNILQTPVSGSAGHQNSFGLNEFTGTPANSFGQNSNYKENPSYQQNDFSRDSGVTQNGNNFNDFSNFETRPERAQAAFERNAAILRQDTSNDGETFSYAYETENGIVAEENGVATNGVEAQGGYSYTGDDGQVYSIRYTADQNGFQAQGDHLPTPPPIPVEILKALEQNALDEANGIYDDGSYDEVKYGTVNNGQYNNNFVVSNSLNNGNNYYAPANYNSNTGNSFNGNDDDTVVTNNALLSDQGPSFRSQKIDIARQNDVNKAYLPPFETSAQTQAVTRQFNRNNRFRSQPPNGFNDPDSNSFRSQVPNTSVPEQQFRQRSQTGANRRYPTPLSNLNQVFNSNQINDGPRNNNGVDKAYLPPFEANPNAPSRIYDQPQTFGQRSRALERKTASREYLPPSANQKSNARNSFSRRPGFSNRNGYQY